MASITPTTKEIVVEFPPYIRVFNDGTIERPYQSATLPVPPLLHDPLTGISSKDVVISHNPKISARLYLPKITNQTERLPILVYFHGGGFFTGSAFCQLFNHHFNNFVPQVNIIVVSVDYRLAPENPLPACYDDCWDALKWVSSHYDNNITNKEPWLIEHGDFNRVFIGGDSAGANIVHNIAIHAGAEALPGGVKISGAFLSHPSFCSSQPIGSELVTLNEQRSKLWNMVYPNAPGGIDNPMINPFAQGAPNLAGLGCSRILVCVAGKDNLRDRGVWYYEAVKKSGWQGELELFEEKEEGHDYHVSQRNLRMPTKCSNAWLCFSSTRIINCADLYFCCSCLQTITIKSQLFCF